MSYGNLQAPGRRIGWGLLIALTLLWGAVIHQPNTALAQSSEATLGLGEYGSATALAGDTLIYTLDIPEAGTYIITAVDDEAAVDFDLIVTDNEGNIIFDDIFEEVELALEPGLLTLEFIAFEDQTLFFVVAGEVGTMSSDPEQPGRLYVGSGYAEETVNNSRYAQLVVPPTASPQRVILYFEAAVEEPFYVSVEGEDIDLSTLESDQGNLLSFWSSGGTYELTVEPYESSSSFSLAIFLSPPPIRLVPGDLVDHLIPANVEDFVFELVLDRPYTLLNIDLLTDGEGFSIELLDSLYAPTNSWSSVDEDFLDAEDLPPGTYYIRISTAPQAEDRTITLMVDGEAGEPIETLVLDEAATGIIEEGTEAVYYQVEIAEAGTVVAAAIASETADAEFDVAVGLGVGEPIWYSADSGSEDVITFVAPVAGIYYVGVESNDTTGDYAVAVSIGGPAPQVLGDGTPALGTVDAYATNLHRLDITAPEQVITLMLVGAETGDLDLRLSGYDITGQNTILEYGLNFGALEVVSAIADETGILEVAVTSYNEEATNYALVAYIDDPRLAVGLWAVDAVGSSEYGAEDNSALQATGAPDTPIAGDYPTAWAPLAADDGEETLEVAFEFPLIPAEINIHESFNPGAIYAVEIYDLAAEEWLTVWEGEPGPLDQGSRIFSIELPPSEIVTDGVRILLDTAAVPGWNEIDAVELRGRP